jgi:hypothetical protein
MTARVSAKEGVAFREHVNELDILSASHRS